MIAVDLAAKISSMSTAARLDDSYVHGTALRPLSGATVGRIFDELAFALDCAGCRALISAERFKTSDYFKMLRELLPELADCRPGELRDWLYGTGEERDETGQR